MTDGNATRSLHDVLGRLEALGSEKMRLLVVRHGGPGDAYGVKLGDVRALAKGIRSDHALGLELWACGQYEAMLLATLILKPKALGAADIDRMVGSVGYAQVADYLMTNVVKLHPDREALRLCWMEAPEPMRARAGWSLTADRVPRDPQGLDLARLLDRIEREMADAPAEAQWTMNFCLAQIGIHVADLRGRAIAIGERLGLYRDYPVTKGCTSPFAPSWIREMVSRQA